MISSGQGAFPDRREPKGMNRCDSGTDSIVWMVEDVRFDLLRRLKDIFFRVIF